MEEVQCGVPESKQSEEGICIGGLYLMSAIGAKEGEKEGVSGEVEASHRGMLMLESGKMKKALLECFFKCTYVCDLSFKRDKYFLFVKIWHV